MAGGRQSNIPVKYSRRRISQNELRRIWDGICGKYIVGKMDICELHEHNLIGVVDFVEAQQKSERGESANNQHTRFMGLQDYFELGTRILEIEK